jgi:hypothetical protein
MRKVKQKSRVGKDRFGVRVGTKRSLMLAKLSNRWKTMKPLCEEAG